jgi:hypothetical protein
MTNMPWKLSYVMLPPQTMAIQRCDACLSGSAPEHLHIHSTHLHQQACSAFQPIRLRLHI